VEKRVKKACKWVCQSKAIAVIYMILPSMAANYFYPDDQQMAFLGGLFSFFLLWAMSKIDNLFN
jgi:hypothetical protein